MAFTVTATQGGTNGPANGMLLRLFVLTGAKSAAQQTGATDAFFFAASSSPWPRSITTTQTGSRVYGAVEIQAAGLTVSALALTTLIDAVNDATNVDTYCSFKATSLTGTPGSTTLGVSFTGGTTPGGPMVMLEVLTAGTLTEDASAPAAASTTTATAVTTAAFTPPAGALLVALVAADGNTGSETMALTDTSGLGLTWTEKVRQAAGGQDYAGIWVAQMPGGNATQALPQPGSQQYRQRSYRSQLAPASGQQFVPPPPSFGNPQPQPGSQLYRRFAYRSQVTPPAVTQAFVSLADVAAETDDSSGIAVSAAVPVADAAGEIDALAVSVTLAVADVAAETDTTGLAVSAAVPVADAAAEADDSTGIAISAATPLADTAGEVDSPFISMSGATLPQPGSALYRQFSYRRQLAPAQPSAVAGPTAITLIDAGAETDDAAGLVVSAQIAVADTAGGVDAEAVSASVPVSDAAGETDSPQITATVPLPDQGAEIDAVTIMATIAVADVAGSLDASATSASVSLADAGGAPDSVQIAAAVPLADVVAGADAILAANSSFTFHLPDAAGAAESWYVVVTGAPDLNGWGASSYRPRWLATPADEHWRAVAQRPRWRAESAYPRWRVQPARPRWRAALMNFDPISALSPENINVNWDSHFAGLEIDPTGQTAGQAQLAVTIALPVSSGNVLAPAQPVTYYTGSWYTGTSIKGWIAYVTVGPGGAVTLVSGTIYDVWSQLHGTPDSPVKFVGQLRVY